MTSAFFRNKDIHKLIFIKELSEYVAIRLLPWKSLMDAETRIIIFFICLNTYPPTPHSRLYKIPLTHTWKSFTHQSFSQPQLLHTSSVFDHISPHKCMSSTNCCHDTCHNSRKYLKLESFNARIQGENITVTFSLSSTTFSSPLLSTFNSQEAKPKIRQPF